jgi:hypothetical protein
MMPTVYDEYKMIEIREDPLIPLMESFISAVKAELKLNNIHTLPESRHHHPEYRWHFDRDPERTYDLIQIQRTYQTGLIFDFNRAAIVFDVDFFKSAFRVHVWAKARLIRVNDQRILWQGVCEISDHRITLDDFQFDPPAADDPWAQANPGTGKASASAQEKLDKAAKACAEELTAQFLGK